MGQSMNIAPRHSIVEFGTPLETNSRNRSRNDKMYRSIGANEESTKGSIEVKKKSMYGTISVNEMALSGMKMFK